MAIERQMKKVSIGGNREKIRVLIKGEPCPARTNESRMHLAIFLNWLADNQSMLECGYEVLEKLTITHNGTQWQAEAEAEADEQPAR